MHLKRLPLLLLLATIPVSLGLREHIRTNTPPPHPIVLAGAPTGASQAAPDTAAFREVIAFPSHLGEVIFGHAEHVDDFDAACADCHHETNASTLDLPHQAYFEDFWIDCTLCHQENGEITTGPQSCANCHHDRPNTVADETRSTKVVIHQNCWSCHEIGTGEEASDMCADCHTGPRLSFAPIEALPEDTLTTMR